MDDSGRKELVLYLRVFDIVLFIMFSVFGIVGIITLAVVGIPGILFIIPACLAFSYWLGKYRAADLLIKEIENSGKMEENAAADLVIWDLQTPDTMAYYHPVSAILYAATSANVRYTMVEGEFLKYDGVLKMDFAAIAEEAMRLQKNLLSRGKGTAKVYY